MKIYVEGQSDKDFLEIYLKYLDVEESLYDIEIVGKDNKIGGKNNIINTKSIEKLEDKFLVIFDADDDYKVAEENIKKQIEEINPNARYEIFLFPNNQDQGNLEDVYKKNSIKIRTYRVF